MQNLAKNPKENQGVDLPMEETEITSSHTSGLPTGIDLDSYFAALPKIFGASTSATSSVTPAAPDPIVVDKAKGILKNFLLRSLPEITHPDRLLELQGCIDTLIKAQAFEGLVHDALIHFHREIPAIFRLFDSSSKEKEEVDQKIGMYLASKAKLEQVYGEYSQVQEEVIKARQMQAELEKKLADILVTLKKADEKKLELYTSSKPHREVSEKLEKEMPVLESSRERLASDLQGLHDSWAAFKASVGRDL